MGTSAEFEEPKRVIQSKHNLVKDVFFSKRFSNTLQFFALEKISMRGRAQRTNILHVITLCVHSLVLVKKKDIRNKEIQQDFHAV